MSWNMFRDNTASLGSLNPYHQRSWQGIRRCTDHNISSGINASI